jgi:hypothetical protein
MAIDKPGFIVGFRGRQQPTELGRRAFYLITEHYSDSADLLDFDDRELSAQESTALLDGSHTKVLGAVESSPRATEIKTIAMARFRTLRGEG